jgi:Lar family restriction alleviation protein
MSEQLLPCPFCGGAAVVKATEFGRYQKLPASYIECSQCEIGTKFSQTVTAATKEWNRRVTTPALPDDVAELIKELREFLGNLPHVTDYETGIAIVEQLVASLESLSRERAALAEGFQAAVRELNDVVDPFVLGSLRDREPDIHTGGRWAETPQRILAIRAALALTRE